MPKQPQHGVLAIGHNLMNLNHIAETRARALWQAIGHAKSSTAYMSSDMMDRTMQATLYAGMLGNAIKRLKPSHSPATRVDVSISGCCVYVVCQQVPETPDAQSVVISDVSIFAVPKTLPQAPQRWAEPSVSLNLSSVRHMGVWHNLKPM
jgi:hypothetical protein